MKALVLLVVDQNPELLPHRLVGTQVIGVEVTVQVGEDARYMRRWGLGEITARVVDLTPQIGMETR